MIKITNLKKIAIIGPESTGKSTLSAELANKFNTIWCPEYAREYLVKNGTNYNFDDLAFIAKGQLKLQNEYTNTAGRQLLDYVFLDTDMYVMKVWCEYVFEKCHSFILEEIALSQFDLYLLCNIDLPWVKDELREYPDEKPRKELYCIYRDILINQQTPWVEISGTYDERFLKAANAVLQI